MNLTQYEDQVGDRIPAAVVMGTVTGPGVDVLPWDEIHCAQLGEHDHSGLIGCRVRRDQAERWNRQATARWRELHSHTTTRCRRDGHRPRMLARVWELQHRGILHVHPVLAFSTPTERAAARSYFGHLAELAGRYGFGHVDRKLEPMRARSAAAYLSAYFVTGREGKLTLQESVRFPYMPTSIVHVSTTLTQASGCTMRALRWRRFFHVREGRSIDFHELQLFIRERDETRKLIRACRAATAVP